MKASVKWVIQKQKGRYVPVARDAAGNQIKAGEGGNLQEAIDEAIRLGCPDDQLPLELVSNRFVYHDDDRQGNI